MPSANAIARLVPAFLLVAPMPTVSAVAKTAEAARFHPPTRGTPATPCLTGHERRPVVEEATTRLAVERPIRESPRGGEV